MFKKILFSIATTIFLFITGVSDVSYLDTDNSVEVKSEVKSEVENKQEENIITEALVEVESPKKESVIETDINKTESEEKKDNKPVVKEEKKEVVASEKKSDNVAVKEETKQTKEVEVIVKEEKNTNVSINNEEKNEEKPIVVEEKKVQEKKEEVTKETIEYNDTESKKMVNDINTIAKQNPDLWDAEGNPLYKVEINKSAMSGEYMYPYRIELIKGKVLNVFPVKFLVYAVDVQRPGFEKEMKYYISMTNI